MKKIRLLTIDDDKFIRHLVLKTLRSQYSSFEVMEADNGRRGQAMLQRHSFDLVLCDWEMPEMNGLELLKWVRSEENLKDQPFILVTSLDSKDNVVQAVEAGVDDYIAKPFTPEQLFNKVMKQLIKSGRLTQEEAASLVRKERIAASGGAEVLAASKAPANKASKRQANSLKALLMQGEARAPAALRDLDRREALVLVKRSEVLPEIGSPVQLGLMTTDEDPPQKLSLKGYVASLQLAERNPNTDNLFVRVHFLKQDTETTEAFTQLLNSQA
ncbi:Response regulator receiver domain-containing protein [Marinospirillum celere]|uniref:Response regulator receiver domain-containing protein n=1 Tax=Marinospirillum celere TaxID=1122252 RepID=A0A1I1HTA2_9GAMM|nr:response regulator [Marinospirillum celere]SFC27091.1 Response regulator receiver domain-containing protein [Marinospirillum celere]